MRKIKRIVQAAGPTKTQGIPPMTAVGIGLPIRLRVLPEDFHLHLNNLFNIVFVNFAKKKKKLCYKYLASCFRNSS